MKKMNEMNKAKDVLEPTRFINIINNGIDAENYIKERGKRGSREHFLKVLDKVPDLPLTEQLPDEGTKTI